MAVLQRCDVVIARIKRNATSSYCLGFKSPLMSNGKIAPSGCRDRTAIRANLDRRLTLLWRILAPPSGLPHRNS